MNTYFIPNDHQTFRDFLISKKYDIVIDYPNMTGITIKRNVSELFYLGMEYQKFLTSKN